MGQARENRTSAPISHRDHPPTCQPMNPQPSTTNAPFADETRSVCHDRTPDGNDPGEDAAGGNSGENKDEEIRSEDNESEQLGDQEQSAEQFNNEDSQQSEDEPLQQQRRAQASDNHVLVPVPKRRAKTAAERRAAKGSKAGNPGVYHGEVLAFLLKHLEEYRKIDKRKGSRGKNKRLEDFWNRVFSNLWQRFF